MDYKSEVERLEAFKPDENSEFWKPSMGQYRVKALTELIEAEPYREENKTDKPQVKIKMLINKNEVTWTMSIGKSLASAYGQLCQLAKDNGSKLKDLQFMIVVTNDGKKNSYTIVKPI